MIKERKEILDSGLTFPEAYASILPGYHQNKEHWNSIILDGTIPDEEIRRMVAESYDLVIGKNKKYKGD
ncbi:MAG: MmcQ/YjbR family DNA-binding protein [Eubacteriales bacterium]|nr:MmcQ/YjbR family DNA-binding protein [Eubacteriales bacterium]